MSPERRQREARIDPVEIWGPVLVAKNEGRTLTSDQQTAFEIRTASLNMANAVSQLIEDPTVQEDPTREASLVAVYWEGRTVIRDLGVTPKMHVGDDPDSFNNPKKIAEYVAGQLLGIDETKLPNVRQALPAIQEHSEEEVNFPGSKPDHEMSAFVMPTKNIEPNLMNWLVMRSMVNLTHHFLASELDATRDVENETSRPSDEDIRAAAEQIASALERYRNHLQEQPSIIGKEVMEGLRAHIGHPVTVEHVWYGVPNTETLKKLRNVNDFSNVEIEGSGIPFVGYGSAIRRITGENGEVLYDNPRIPEDYDRRFKDEVDDMVRLTFGDEVAEGRIREREEYERDWEERKTRANQEAQARSAELTEEGERYVKDDLKDEWRKYAHNNTQDGYSAAVVEASNKVGKALSEGKTPEEAEKEMYNLDLTGFQAGCLAQAISHFHPRGDEFRQWWNRQYMSENEAVEATGVVNPAILTISPKES